MSVHNIFNRLKGNAFEGHIIGANDIEWPESVKVVGALGLNYVKIRVRVKIAADKPAFTEWFLMVPADATLMEVFRTLLCRAKLLTVTFMRNNLQ